MRKRLFSVLGAMVFLASSDVFAQNVVTTDAGTTYNIPKFSGGSTLTSSALFEQYGNVGIGTSNPQYTLHLYGSNPILEIQSSGQGYPGLWFTNATGTYTNQIDGADGSLYWWNTDTKTMVLLQNGNLGLGTVIPQNVLSVSGGGINVDQNDDNHGNAFPNFPSDFSTFGISFGSHSGEGIGSPRETSPVNLYGLDFYTGFSPRLAITQQGNVGIGTRAPTSPLQVMGSVTISGAGAGLTFPDGSTQYSAAGAGPGGGTGGLIATATGGDCDERPRRGSCRWPCAEQ